MNPEDFKESNAGRCIRSLEGYWAFVPNPLPPKLEIDWKLSSLLSEADRALGELGGTGRQLPNPHLLISPYSRREAVLSSRIEGTLSSMSDLFYFEADPSAPVKFPDVKEVQNYVTAMNYGLERLKTLPISQRLIQEIHEKLMADVRGNHATPGEFRRSQNWIGPGGCGLKDATYVPPPVHEMQQALSDWEKYIHAESDEPSLVTCALLHYQFEAIHPFLDGNGRVGRLLISFFLCERNYLSQPLLYLSAFFEKYRDEYYRRLLEVSQKGNWRGWIEFFLRGIAIQAKESLTDAHRILDLHQKYRALLGAKRIPQTAVRLVEHLFINPVISISKLAEDWKMDFPAVKRGVDKLIELNILKEITGQQRHRLFAAPELLKILAPE